MIRVGSRDQGESALADMAPDLTPMLDILFILLLFFMLTAGAVFQSLNLTLPSSVAEDLTLAHTPDHILLEIRTGSFALDGREIKGFETLKAAIPETMKAKPGHELIIAGDKDVAIETLLKVLTYLQSRNVSAANILMRKEPGE
ncbi:MAG TPA: hypothetical protein DCG48_08430 [Rhodospirillaceae bacterium]|nr:hypothetical protein [Rhodospirillaceae bacterium]|tara:strand:- start:12503 stop:12934 length:432 start_codon:yes stop_codon:yes gene_type:complete